MSDEISSTFDIVKPFLPPLIRDVAETLLKIKDLYDTAQHNNKTVELLIIRISKVDRIISILETSETIEKGTYSSLEDLNQVLREMRDYIEQITQSTTLLKFLKAKNSEVEFKKLCSKYDSIMISLNVSLSLNIVMNNKVDEEKESKVLNEDIKEALRFQSAIAESIKISNEKTELKIDRFFGEIRNIANVMKKLEGANQKKIDDIFNDSMLPFDDYKELDDEPRKEILRKYEHIKTQQEYAFKILNKSAKDLGAEVINKVKNQVTILKKLKDCHNIIRFFGLTFDESIGKYYLVTEWAEKRNLREYIEDKRSKGQNIETKLKIRFAYDIAKGLNFLSAVKIVHRDIRAENIVITLHDVAKITNFCLSRTFEEPTKNLTANYECFRYCAPEILRRKLAGEEEKNYDKYGMKCEVYSFGVVLWEIAEFRVPYEQFENFLNAVKIIIGGYRESFTPDTDIPEKYRILVNKAVDQEPSRRPTISKMLTELHDLYNLYQNPHVGNLGNVKSPVRKSTADHVSSAIDKAIEEHKKNPNDPNGKSELYKIFDTCASMGIPRAKYWKAYYIQKGFSDLTCSEDEKLKIAVKLFKEAADCGDLEAQNRYGFLVKQGKGVKKNDKEAIEYFEKAAHNNHVEAIYNLAICYLDNDDKESGILGRYYLTMAASRNLRRAIDRCKEMNISY